MTTIYHNFPAISVPLQGTKTHNTIISLSKTTAQPIANIQYNDGNYTAESIVICDHKDEVGEFGYLVIKCYQDLNNVSSNLIYVALPLVMGGESATSTDVDAVIDGIKTSSSSVVTIDIDSHIDDSKKCSTIVAKNGGDFPVTITFSKPITLKQTSLPTGGFYPSSSLRGLSIEQTKNAQCQKKDLDWIMTCELLGDDGNSKEVKVNVNPPTATTMSYFAMILLIVCAAYYAGPIFYEATGIQNYVNGNISNFDHFSVNVFVGFNMLIAAVLSIFYGIQNGAVFIFIGLSILFSFRAGTVGILSSKEILDKYSNKKWFDFYSQGLFNKGMIFGVIALFLLATGISLMSTFMALKKDVGFSISLGVFVASIFAILIAYTKFIDPQPLPAKE